MHIAKLAQKIVVDGQETEPDWSGHTDDKFDLEATSVGDISKYKRAFIEVKATNNAYIALSEAESNDSRMYQICFGDDNNHKSWIGSSDEAFSQEHAQFGEVFTESE